ncbi:MAG TPA: hypothetical protein VIE43_25825 [Thermoanaerobaculia bacterium]|nr:hypothetical protein [Thermoanaerobaculia bacterium]
MAAKRWVGSQQQPFSTRSRSTRRSLLQGVIDQSKGEHHVAEHCQHRAGRPGHRRYSREFYADLVSKHFRCAYGNGLEEVVAMFTDDPFATFVVAPEPFHGKQAIRGFYTSSSRTTRASSPRCTPW